MKIGLEKSDDGHLVGRHPDNITPGEWDNLGLRSSIGKAVRAKCIDCCGGNQAEVRKCVSTTCPLWPFRMRSNPFREKPSEEQRAAAAERFARIRAANAPA